MANKEIISWSARSLGSLAGYYLARQSKVKDWFPYVVLGGLAGSVLASLILANEKEKTPELKRFTNSRTK